MATFIFGQHEAVGKLPAAKAIMLPATMRQVLPKTASTRCGTGHEGVVGRRQVDDDEGHEGRKGECAPKPAQTTRRSRP